MDSVLQTNGISWSNCVGTSVDNTSVNLGKNNSIKTRVLAKNSAIYFMGCPCHVVHNAALKASNNFKQVNLYYTILYVYNYMCCIQIDYEI